MSCTEGPVESCSEGPVEAPDLEGTSLAVLQETSYHVVSGLGPVLWELLAGRVSEEDLVGSLLQTGDAPADAADRIHGALTALCYEGLAVRSDAQR